MKLALKTFLEDLAMWIYLQQQFDLFATLFWFLEKVKENI